MNRLLEHTSIVHVLAYKLNGSEKDAALFISDPLVISKRVGHPSNDSLRKVLLGVEQIGSEKVPQGCKAPSLLVSIGATSMLDLMLWLRDGLFEQCIISRWDLLYASSREGAC